MTEQTIDDLAQAMHDAYEVAAARAGWETQQRSRVPYEAVPEANKTAMRAGVLAVLDALLKDGWCKITASPVTAQPTEEPWVKITTHDGMIHTRVGADAQAVLDLVRSASFRGGPSLAAPALPGEGQ